MKDISTNQFWNGIKIGDYKVIISMEKILTTSEQVGNMVAVQEFKYRDLERKLNDYFNKFDKIALRVPYGQLKRRIKTLTEKLGYKIENTTSYNDNTRISDLVYIVLTK
jgi:hypothetical protein